MTHIHWALIGMVAYSLVSLLVKLATRDGSFSSFLVLAIAAFIVGPSAIGIAALRGDFRAFQLAGIFSPNALWSYATGLALILAVSSLFRALSLGPASEVVPVYGLFAVGGAVLGIIFLGEPVEWKKLLGIALAGVSIYLISR